MFERGVSIADVRYALQSGRVIEAYPDDEPYPSRLILAWLGSRPLHVVVAQVPEGDEVIVITVYEPDPRKWEAGFSRRRAP